MLAHWPAWVRDAKNRKEGERLPRPLGSWPRRAGVPSPPGPVSPAVAEPAGTGLGRRAHPSPPPAAPPGRTHSMIRETCSRTGTLRSLKAVVMKQPKVSAAITLSEKAKSEFARDRTVFIVTPFP